MREEHPLRPRYPGGTSNASSRWLAGRDRQKLANLFWPPYAGQMANYMIAQLDEVPAQRCPCGFAKRAFAASPKNVASMHIVDIQQDSRTHYHKRMTEIYLVLEGEGQIELDGELFPVKPMTAI